MQEAERRVLEEFRAHRPGLVEPFLRQLPKARAVTLERLISVLLREGFEGVRPEAASRAPALIAETMPLTATGRLALTEPPRFRDPGGHERLLTHPVEAWMSLAEHGMAGDLSNDDIQEVAEELANSICQHALALVGAAPENGVGELPEHISIPRPFGSSCTDLTDAENGQTSHADTSFSHENPGSSHEKPSPLDFFEQSVVDGHPAHYGAKSRRGLGVTQTPDYAPEWRCCFEVPLVAVAVTHAIRASAESTTSTTSGLVDHLAAEHPQAVATANAELLAGGLNPAEYELIPAHPWQVRFVLPEKFAAHFRSRTVVPLTATIPARPLMSSRTLSPVTTPRTRFPSHIKTSVDWRMTMAVRGVSRYAVENGPAMTALLDEVLHREGGFGGHLRIQGERAAAGFLARTEEDAPLQSSLGAIIRDNPEADLAAGEVALPVAALYSTSPTSRELLVREVLDDLVACRQLSALSAAARDFAAEYSRIVLPALLTLLVRYGVALEAHPQNTVLVLRDGAPVRLLVRDLGGARVLPERLRRQGLHVDLLPDSPIIAASEQELRDKLSYSLLTNHLGELLSAISYASGTPQRTLWTYFADTAEAAFADLAGEFADSDRRALLAEPLPVKTFLSMRLDRAVTDSSYVAGPNPLRTPNRDDGQRPGPTTAETRTAAFLASDQPHLLGAFQRQLPLARQQSLRALIAALLREDLVTTEPHEDDDLLRIAVTSPSTLVVQAERAFAFGPVQVTSVRRGDTDRQLTHPSELLDLLEQSGADAHPWTALTSEIEESTANLAMAYACSTHRRGELRALAEHLAVSGADQLALRAERASPERVPRLTGEVLDRHLLFDRLCTEGHNLHPWGRSRVGMSPASAFQHAADCAGDACLRLIAVRNDHLLDTTDDQDRDVGALLFEHFPEYGAQARNALAEALCDRAGLDAYRFVPVHGWQARHAILPGYADEIASGVVVALPEPHLAVTPTVSLRTVVTEPGRHGRRLVIKTALDVLITTSRRSISPATTYNGPRLSQLLTQLVDDDPILRPRARVVRELAGTCWQPPGSTGRPGDWRCRNLSALCREDPGEYAAPGELAVTGCALYASSPVTGRAVLADFVETHRANHGLAPAAAALSVLERYADLLLPTVLTLLVTHGIGLEAHLQNTLVVWREGWPVRLLLRDFAGIRVHRPRFRAVVQRYRTHPESIIMVDELDTARDKAYYSTVQANLSEVVRTLVLECEVDEHACWRHIRERSEAAFTALAERDAETAERAALDRAALYAPDLHHKAFVRTRLDPDLAEAYHRVPNPLRDDRHAGEASEAE